MPWLISYPAPSLDLSPQNQMQTCTKVVHLSRFIVLFTVSVLSSGQIFAAYT